MVSDQKASLTSLTSIFLRRGYTRIKVTCIFHLCSLTEDEVIFRLHMMKSLRGFWHNLLLFFFPRHESDRIIGRWDQIDGSSKAGDWLEKLWWQSKTLTAVWFALSTCVRAWKTYTATFYRKPFPLLHRGALTVALTFISSACDAVLSYFHTFIQSASRQTYLTFQTNPVSFLCCQQRIAV